MICAKIDANYAVNYFIISRNQRFTYQLARLHQRLRTRYLCQDRCEIFSDLSYLIRFN